MSLLPGRHFTGCAPDSEVSRLQEIQGVQGGQLAMITDIATAQHVGLITLAHPTGHSLCGITTYIMLLNSYRLPSLSKLFFKPNPKKISLQRPFSKNARCWASFGPESRPSSFSSRSLLVVHNVHFRLCTSLLAK